MTDVEIQRLCTQNLISQLSQTWSFKGLFFVFFYGFDVNLKDNERVKDPQIRRLLRKRK